MDLTIEALIAQLNEARNRLNRVVDKINTQAEVYPTWQLKQVLDHITGWDELVLATLRQYQRGEIPERTVRGINRFNDASVAARQVLSVEQSREAYDSARQEVLQLLRDLPAEISERKYRAPWGGTCTIPDILKIFVEHERVHAEQIEKTLEKN